MSILNNNIALIITFDFGSQLIVVGNPILLPYFKFKLIIKSLPDKSIIIGSDLMS